MNFSDFDPLLHPTAEQLATKLQAYTKSKDGHLLEQVSLDHKEDRYYWCIISKSFILINGSAQMFLLPWKPDENGQMYVYSHHFFAQSAVFKVPKEEIVYMGFN